MTAIPLDYGFMSERWKGCKSLKELNGHRIRYRGVYVDVIDIQTSKKIGRMEFSLAMRKFS